MVRDGSLSGLRTTYRRIAISAVTVALVAAAPPVFAADPAFRSYPVLTENAGISSITLGPDGAMWFTGPGVDVVGRIDAGGSVTEFSLAPFSRPIGIATGPDGALWVTLRDADAIGRLTPAGELVTYPLPADESSPVGITVGPDGAMWFTERAGDRIGRIDTVTGLIDEYDLETGSSPTDITTGPDGALWFTEFAVPAVGRLDPATGSITHVGLPASSAPTGIATADGAVWVILRATDQIARIEPDGTMTTFDVPADASKPSAIVADPAHDVLWFTERTVDRLVRLSFDGSMTEFDADAGAGLSAIAVDAAGRPWVTQAMLDSIGVLDLDVAPPDTTPPTVWITSPAVGAWTVLGTDALPAGFGCADEGGSGLAVCEGTVPVGHPVPDDAVGVRSLAVHAADGAGNTADAAAPYLVFGSASGSVLDRAPSRPGEALTLELGMELTPKAAPLATATTAPVACDTNQPLGAPEPADLRTRVTHLGELSIRWTTSRTWSGCRSLTLSFSEPGWTGADAVFGPIALPAQKR